MVYKLINSFFIKESNELIKNYSPFLRDALEQLVMSVVGKNDESDCELNQVYHINI